MEQKPDYTTKRQTIFRTIKNEDNPFVMIDRRPIENDTLSWGAKGVLAYLLSRPNNWTVRLRDLINHSTDGVYKIRGFIRELTDAGHIQRVEERDPVTKRFIQYTLEVYELPFRTKPVTNLPQAEKPQAENLMLNNTDSNDIDDEEASPLEKFDDPQFGQIITDWNNLHTFLIPTHANLLACMLDEWRDHVKLLPEGHPDKSLDPVAIFKEAMITTGKNARNPHSLAYMDRIIKNWIHLGYGYGPNGKQPKKGQRTNGNNQPSIPQDYTDADRQIAAQIRAARGLS